MKKCKKCGVKNKLNATFCANCGSELKTINIKRISIILVAIVVIIAGVGFIKINFFDSKSSDIEILNSKEARKEIFKDDKIIQEYLDESLSSDLDKIINDNYLCVNDLYLDEPPEIEILEEDNKRIRNLGEGYYLVEEFIKDGNQGTLEYYLADEDIKKIDCSMNSGKYDVTLDNEDRITEIYQDDQLLYEIEYQGDDIIYYYEDGSYIQINTNSKDYKITDKDGNSTIQSNYKLDEEYDTKYKNDLLVSKSNQDDYNEYYYYDNNGIFNGSEIKDENDELEAKWCYFYDFEKGYMYSIHIIERDILFAIGQYTIDFSYNPYNLVWYNVTDDFLKVPFYLGESKQLLSNSHKTLYEGEYSYSYGYEEKDILSSMGYYDNSQEEYIYEYDKETYYCQYTDTDDPQQGIFLKIDEIEEGKLSLRLKYYDKTNKENDVQLIDENVEFDKKTGATEEFIFLNSFNDYARGYIEWKDKSDWRGGSMYITIEDATNGNMICEDIKLYEQNEEDFMNSIGNEHDIDLSFK